MKIVYRNVTKLTNLLILQYPEFFTFGLFSRKGPKREDLVNMKFCVTLTGKGWEKKIEDPEQQHTDPPTVSKTVTVISNAFFPMSSVVERLLMERCINLVCYSWYALSVSECNETRLSEVYLHLKKGCPFCPHEDIQNSPCFRYTSHLY